MSSLETFFCNDEHNERRERHQSTILWKTINENVKLLNIIRKISRDDEWLSEHCKRFNSILLSFLCKCWCICEKKLLLNLTKIQILISKFKFLFALKSSSSKLWLCIVNDKAIYVTNMLIRLWFVIASTNYLNIFWFFEWMSLVSSTISLDNALSTSSFEF